MIQDRVPDVETCPVSGLKKKDLLVPNQKRFEDSHQCDRDWQNK